MTDLQKAEAEFKEITEAVIEIEAMRSEAMATIAGTDSRLADVMIDVARGKAKGTQIDNIHREHFKAQAIASAAPVAIEKLLKEKEAAHRIVQRLHTIESKAKDAAQYIPLRDEVIRSGDCSRDAERELNRFARAAGKRDEFDRLIHELRDYNGSYYKRKEGPFTFQPDPE